VSSGGDNWVGKLNWVPVGNGQNNSMHHHNNNVPAVAGGVVGGLFVADTIALVLIYVIFAINSQPD
jgi:hypothetical protein